MKDMTTGAASGRPPGDTHDSADARAHDRGPDVALIERLVRYRDDGLRYAIGRRLGVGGQGEVYRVRDRLLGRHLAMKVARDPISPGTATRLEGGVRSPGESRSLSRFLDEAKVTGQLDHPGIVPVHDLAVDAEGRVFFTMKLVRGRDMSEVIEQARRGTGGWSLARGLGVLLKVCEAMAYAHAKGVVHRDLKPSNIRVGRFGEVSVMDWGVAKVVGPDDSVDGRSRGEPDTLSAEVQSDRQRQAADDPASPVVTAGGDILGTPAWMPPEQALGNLEQVGFASDVYSVGAILYQLLTGRPPYTTPGSLVSRRVVLERVQEGPPVAVDVLTRRAPPELVAICERAMARTPADRHRDMSELADDLRAFLEGRVVRSYEDGSLAQLRKWFGRNRPLGLALSAVAALLAVGFVGMTLASSELHQKNQALEGVTVELDERNIELTEQKVALEAALAQTRLAEEEASANAFAAREARGEAERDRREILRLAAFRDLDDLSVRTDALWPARPELIPAYDAWLTDARALVAGLATHRAELEALRSRARPYPESRRQEDDALRDGLAGVRAVVERYESALAEAQERARSAPLPDHVIEALRTVEASLVEARRREAEFEARVAGITRWRFDSEEDDWRHRQLVAHIEALEAFADPVHGVVSGTSGDHGWGIERRRQFAATVDHLTVSGPQAREAWAAAIRSIADPGESPAYAGLQIGPQSGILPLGRDPDSDLWEFWHVQTGVRPERGPDGRLVPAASSGLVLVLLPGGTFLMGAQRDDPAAPLYDPRADGDSPPHEVRLAPFFLSKYEMTQAQWERFTGVNPSHYDPEQYSSGFNEGGRGWTGRHPVENVDWFECRRVVQRLGLTLPSEAQWEYACRARTTTVFWTGDDEGSLAGAANLMDSFAKQAGLPRIQEWSSLDDGHTVHAEVGSFRPNAFGLHDMLGNVWEWCDDGYRFGGFYRRSPVEDPRRDPEGAPFRVNRGGGFMSHERYTRCGDRSFDLPTVQETDRGVRPARAVSGL